MISVAAAAATAAAGHFYLELKGLHPGRYHYKFIIDNNWDVDPSALKTLDSEVCTHG
jgi:hypothetical protein